MDTHELERPASASATATNTTETVDREFSLPPHDRGHAAWRLLCAAYIFEALLWGFPLSFGVFQEYYSRLPQFKDNAYIGIVGTVASGISYIAAPVVIPLMARYARYRRRLIWIGWPICLLGLVAGSFAQTLETLILTQGALYGVGFVTFYYPILSILNEYWITRRGMAYGIMCSASGLSGATMPFAISALLGRYGFPTTLRVIAAALFVITGPLIPLLKGRLPGSAVSSATRIDWAFLRAAPFWMYSFSNFAMGLGYFFPALYVPSYAVSKGLSAVQGALLLAVMSVSQIFGQFTFGYLSDRKMPIDVLTVTSPLVAAVAAFTCWGFASNIAHMIVFAMIYGFFGSGYTALWGRIGTSISRDSTAAFTAFGLLNLGKGLGNILTGPLGGALLGARAERGAYGAGRYERIVLFTGSCMLLSAAIILLYRVKDLKLTCSMKCPIDPAQI